MATKITYSYDGDKYCLEYTKRSVKTMEDRGFSPAKILEAPMSYLPELFAGAFIANHKFLARAKIDDMFEKFTNKRELVNTLIQMYNEPINALTEDNEDEGNGIAWEVGN